MLTEVRFIPAGNHAKGIEMPKYETAGASGMDLKAAAFGTDCQAVAEYTIPPGQRVLVQSGFRIEMEPGFEAQVRPRSGLALRRGLTVLNSPGTVDHDYRGEIGVILINLGAIEQTILRGSRVAQLVIAPVARATIRLASPEMATPTHRGGGGFGSTGD